MAAAGARARCGRAARQPSRGGQPGGDAPGGGQQDRAAATAGTQRDHTGGPVVRGAEDVGEPFHRMHVGAAESVDRLIRVTDRDQLAAVPGQCVEQRFLRGIGVLVLVHQHDVVRLALTVPGRRPAEQGGRDPDDLRIVIGGHRGQVEARGVPVQEAARGDPVVPPGRAAEPGQAATIQAAFGRPEQEVTQLGGEPAGGQRRLEAFRPALRAVPRLAAEQPADLQQLLRPGQQGRWHVRGQHVFPAHQRVGVTVEGQCERLPGGPAQPGGDPFSELLCCLAAEGEDEHPLRVDPALGDALYHRLDDRGGLARASARPGRAAARPHERPPPAGPRPAGAGQRSGRAGEAGGRRRSGGPSVPHSSRGHRHPQPGCATARRPGPIQDHGRPGIHRPDPSHRARPSVIGPVLVRSSPRLPRPIMFALVIEASGAGHTCLQ